MTEYTKEEFEKDFPRIAKWNEMELDELRARAKKLGYKLVKIRQSEKLMPCICGTNRRKHKFRFDRDTGDHYVILECANCGRSAEGLSEKEALHNWNLMVLGGR